jgi:hypothetical protein
MRAPIQNLGLALLRKPDGKSLAEHHSFILQQAGSILS